MVRRLRPHAEGEPLGRARSLVHGRRRLHGRRRRPPRPGRRRHQRPRRGRRGQPGVAARPGCDDLPHAGHSAAHVVSGSGWPAHRAVPGRTADSTTGGLVCPEGSGSETAPAFAGAVFVACCGHPLRLVSYPDSPKIRHPEYAMTSTLLLMLTVEVLALGPEPPEPKIPDILTVKPLPVDS